MSGVGGYNGGHVSGLPPAQAPQPTSTVPTPGPRRRGGAAFTVIVTVAILLGACALAVVLFASGAPNALVVGVILAALPVGPLIACFMWLDRYEPEPLSLLALAFGWGAFVATTVALVLQVLEQATFALPQSWAAAIVAPITEEAAKGLFVVLLLFARRHEVDGILDGIVYAGVVAVGFAFTENILYLASAYMGGDGLGEGGLGAATGTFVVRGVFSPFAHPFFTVAIGIGVGYAVVAKSGFVRFLAPLLGYCVAVACHALWNGSVFFAGGRLFVLTYLFAMVPAFLLTVGFAVWVRTREGRMLVRALTDCAQRGFLPHAEVPWLVRIPGRRAARRFAKANGGPAAARTMAEYQQQAVELGFLHDRFLRGTAPTNFVQRGQAMVNQLAVLRPYVAFPPVAGRGWADASRGGPR